MNIRNLTALSAALTAASLAHAGEEIHSDIKVLIDDGRLVTGAVDFSQPGEPVVPHVRVFGSELGETIPHFTDEPGFNADAGALPAGTVIGFDILDALWTWNAAAQRFDAVPAETLFVGLSTIQRETPTTPGATVPGFNFATAGAGGGFHQHLNFFLNPPQTTGVYLYVSRLTTTASGVGDSDPIYIVLNEGDSEETHEAAEAHVEAVAVNPDCPGDVNGSGAVNFDDLNQLLAVWGQTVPVGLVADVTLDGQVNFDDLNALLANWGADCP